MMASFKQRGGAADLILSPEPESRATPTVSSCKDYYERGILGLEGKSEPLTSALGVIGEQNYPGWKYSRRSWSILRTESTKRSTDEDTVLVASPGTMLESPIDSGALNCRKDRRSISLPDQGSVDPRTIVFGTVSSSSGGEKVEAGGDGARGETIYSMGVRSPPGTKGEVIASAQRGVARVLEVAPVGRGTLGRAVDPHGPGQVGGVHVVTIGRRGPFG
ncbi:hypothetical protein B296_00001381 [Ensete ventricosum]|uniref:Uncharacterized protein n=1 Tax=Ensete ventricosum TaxID=4639 RepID=A0A427AMV1_ENSVE|nr:hypothetical protein B296_00001381 [Ensete ventricosum]